MLLFEIFKYKVSELFYIPILFTGCKTVRKVYFLFVQSVFFQKLRSAGSGTDTGIFIIHTHIDHTVFLKFVNVFHLRQMNGIVFGNVTFKAVTGKGQTGESEFFCVIVVTVFLRLDVIHIFFFRCAMESAHSCVRAHIHIAFAGTHTKVGKRRRILCQFPFKA